MTPPYISVFEQFGLRPVINACGIYTDLGGSMLSPQIMAAIQEMNLSWVEMPELLDRTGEQIAQWLAVPAARVTPGASAAIALGIAACMTRGDRAAGDRLPDTSGLPSEVLFQRAQLTRYKYGVCARLAGARLIGVGSDANTSARQLREAIGPQTAAIFVPAHLDGIEGTLRLEEVASIAHEHGLPVVVDAAYMNFPLVPEGSNRDYSGESRELMRSFHARGADLSCFSAKYFWGPNAGGFVCGRHDLLATIRDLDFTRFESGMHKPFGRAFKMGRFEVAATALALRAWLDLDHRERLATYERQVSRLREDLGQTQGLLLWPGYFTMDERWVKGPVNCLVIDFVDSRGMPIERVRQALYDYTPRIIPFTLGQRMTIVMESVRDGEERIVARALREALHSPP